MVSYSQIVLPKIGGCMGTIIKKKIKGINYYYYVESKRVDGKSKYVNQKYLGSADKLLKMANESGKTLQNQVLYAHEVTFGRCFMPAVCG